MDKPVYTACRYCGDLTEFDPRILPAEDVVCRSFECQNRVWNAMARLCRVIEYTRP